MKETPALMGRGFFRDGPMRLDPGERATSRRAAHPGSEGDFVVPGSDSGEGVAAVLLGGSCDRFVIELGHRSLRGQRREAGSDQEIRGPVGGGARWRGRPRGAAAG